MSDHDQRILQTAITSAAVGGFVFLALAGWVLAFDVSSIATMTAGATEKDLISALFIGGLLTKGATVAAAFGLALAAVRSAKDRRSLPRPRSIIPASHGPLRSERLAPLPATTQSAAAAATSRSDMT